MKNIIHKDRNVQAIIQKNLRDVLILYTFSATLVLAYNAKYHLELLKLILIIAMINTYVFYSAKIWLSKFYILIKPCHLILQERPFRILKYGLHKSDDSGISINDLKVNNIIYLLYLKLSGYSDFMASGYEINSASNVSTKSTSNQNFYLRFLYNAEKRNILLLISILIPLATFSILLTMIKIDIVAFSFAMLLCLFCYWSMVKLTIIGIISYIDIALIIITCLLLIFRIYL